MRRSQLINFTGAVLTAVVLVVVFATKVLEGAWVAVLAMGLVFAAMFAVRRYYTRYEAEVAPPPGDGPAAPAHVHAVVLVIRVSRPALRALALAKALRADTLEAVAAEEGDGAEALQAAWREHGIDVPLRVLDAPYRDIGPPLLAYIESIRGALPRSVVTVFVPEVVVEHGWQNLLHNQSALRLKARLLSQPRRDGHQRAVAAGLGRTRQVSDGQARPRGHPAAAPSRRKHRPPVLAGEHATHRTADRLRRIHRSGATPTTALDLRCDNPPRSRATWCGALGRRQGVVDMTIVDNAVYVDGIRAATPQTTGPTSCCANGTGWPGSGCTARTRGGRLGRREFGLHQLAVEDTIKAHQRPKLERYGDILFTVLRPARYIDEVEEVEFGEVHVFTGADFVVTIRHAESPDLGRVRHRMEDTPELLRLGPEAVLYAILDQVVDEYEPVVAGWRTTSTRSRTSSSAATRRSRAGSTTCSRGHRVPAGDPAAGDDARAI